MNRTFYLVILLISSPYFVIAQGCSDAGFCTMGAMKPDQNFNRQAKLKLRSIALQYYRAKTTASPIIDAVTLELNLALGDKMTGQIKLPYQQVTGILGENSGLGDISLSVTRNVLTKSKWELKGSLGLKIPTGNSRARAENGLTLPMYYQTSLGSFDVIAGLSFLSKNWLFAVGYQQALTANENDFTYGEWVRFSDKAYLGKYDVGIGLRRGTDIMFRAEHNIRFSNYSFNFGVLPIYRISRDRGIIRSRKNEGKVDTTGLALSILGGFSYHLNVSSSFKFIYGYKLTDRATNPDGLTRNWVVNATYEVRF